MNWFAIGAGLALIIVGLTNLVRKGGGEGRLSRSAAISLGLVGLFFLYLGASPRLEF
jgi:hypothetical protein